MRVGERIRFLMESCHCSRMQVCNDLKIAPSTLNGYISSRRMPDCIMLMQFADYFQVSTDYLLGYPEEFV